MAQRKRGFDWDYYGVPWWWWIIPGRRKRIKRFRSAVHQHWVKECLPLLRGILHLDKTETEAVEKRYWDRTSKICREEFYREFPNKKRRDVHL
jgi:hypothetical protein